MTAFSDRALHLALLLTTVLWGLSWCSSKVLALHLDAVTMSFLRFIVSAVCVALALLFLPSHRKLPTVVALPYLLLGAAAMAGSQIFVFLGLANGYPGLASVVFNTVSPLATFVMVALFFNARVLFLQWIGLIVGIVACLLIFEIWRVSAHSLLSSGNLFFLLNAVCFSLVTIASQQAAKGMSPIVFAALGNLAAAAMTLPWSFHDGFGVLFSLNGWFWVNLLFMAGIAGGVGTTIYFFGAQRIGSQRASAYLFIVPVSGLAFSWIFFDEAVSMWTAIGGVVGMCGVWLVQRR